MHNVRQRCLAASMGCRLWTLFWVLVVLQASDLETTYLALSAGLGHEGNPFLAGLILTPYAPLVKTLALAYLALLIVSGTRCGRPAPGRLLALARVLVAAYLVIVVHNLMLVVHLA